VGGADSARKFIGQFNDQSNLSYLNARYYEGYRGQFLSQDPTFLAIGDPKKLREVTGLDQQKFLSDPQLANSTSYGRDNPITNKDPDGKFINVVAGAAIGDFVGVASLFVSDVRNHQTSSVSDYIAAGLGGAVNGAAFASGEGWLYGVGGAGLGGAVQSTVSQGANYVKGASDSFSVGQVIANGAAQAPFGFIPGLRVPGITAGRNSFEAIGKNVFTRYDNGYINSFSMTTAGKIFVANQVYGAPQNFAQGAAQSYVAGGGSVQSLISSLSSLVSALQSLVQSLSAAQSTSKK
jgi:RHS repeat-associated protein